MSIQLQNINEKNNIINYQDYVLSDPHLGLYDIIISNTQNQAIMTYQDALPILESEFFQNQTEVLIEDYYIAKKDLIDTEETRCGYFIKTKR